MSLPLRCNGSQGPGCHHDDNDDNMFSRGPLTLWRSPCRPSACRPSPCRPQNVARSHNVLNSDGWLFGHSLCGCGVVLHCTRLILLARFHVVCYSLCADQEWVLVYDLLVTFRKKRVMQAIPKRELKRHRNSIEGQLQETLRLLLMASNYEGCEKCETLLQTLRLCSRSKRVFQVAHIKKLVCLSK